MCVRVRSTCALCNRMIEAMGIWMHTVPVSITNSITFMEFDPSFVICQDPQ